jgi:hypothetical protein
MHQIEYPPTERKSRNKTSGIPVVAYSRSAASTRPRWSWGVKPPRISSKEGEDSMNASTSKVSKDRDPRIGRIYLTAILAAVPVAAAAIVAASSAAAPAQLSLDAAGQNAVVLKVAPPSVPCWWPRGGEIPRSVCPGSNQKDTTRTGSLTGMREPGTGMGQPGTGTDESGSRMGESGTGTDESGNGMGEPGTGTDESGNGMEGSDKSANNMNP